MSNRFAALDPDETLTDSSVSQKNLLKKAEKKLREIESLKAKQGELSKEEAEKVASEQHWHKILRILTHSNGRSNGEDENTKSKQQQRRYEEKQKRSEAARKKKEADEQRKADLRAKTQAAKEKYESEKPSKSKTREQEEEYSKRFREQHARWEEEQKQKQKKRSFDKMQSSSKSKLDYMLILGEFDTLNRTHKNIDKVFRILSIKYHPDKNIGRDEWATAMQQHLVNVRDHLLAQSL
jgi:hypothetical protein